jgi:outer membrane cobalamin receptor
MKWRLVPIASAWLGVICANPAGAQTPSEPPLEEVVVIGHSLEDDLPAQLAEFGTRVDVVTAAQIQNGGYIDVAGALEFQAPGLYITSKNGPFDYVQISFQGSRTEDVLWLVDGIRLHNRLHAGTTPLDTIPAAMVDHIEVLNGGQALFYGTQAIAGAVNIVTKPFTDHPTGSASVGADSNDGKHLSGYFSDMLANNYFVLYGSHDESPGIQPYPTADYQPSGTDRHRDYSVTTIGGKYGYNFPDNLALTLMAQHTDAKLDFAKPYLVYDAFNQRDENLLSLKLDWLPSDAFKVYVKDYYHWWSSYYTELDNGSVAYTYTPGAPGQITVVNDHDFWGFKDYGLNVLAEAALNRGMQYLLGYDLQGYTGRDAVLVIQQETEHVNAVFGQLRTTPDFIPGAHLALGARYNMPSFGQNAFVWNGMGQYDITDAFFVRANFGTAFRLPTAEELFANDPDDERGDPNLKPETSSNANASIGGKWDIGPSALSWEAITFYRRIKNLIDYQYLDTATGQEVFGNVPGTVTVRGEELTLAAYITPSLSGNLSATYSHARQSGDDFQFDQVPVTQAKAGVDYHPAARYGASINYVRVGDLDDEPLGVGNGRVGYGNYSLLEVSGRVFLDPDRHQRVDLHVTNLFNHVYYTSLAYGFEDVSQAGYVTHNLGLPRTFQLNYTYAF